MDRNQKSSKYNTSYFDDITDDGTSPLAIAMTSKNAPNSRSKALGQSFVKDSLPGAMCVSKDIHSSFHSIEEAEKKKLSMMESVSDEDNTSGQDSGSQCEKDGDISPQNNDEPIPTDDSFRNFVSGTNYSSNTKCDIDPNSVSHTGIKATAPLSLNLTSDSTNSGKLIPNMNSFMPPDLRYFSSASKSSQQDEQPKVQVSESNSKPFVTHIDYADIGVDLISKIPDQR